MTTDNRPVPMPPRPAPRRWICLVHGVISCKCGSRDVAPFGNGEFNSWSKPRASDIWVDLKPPPVPPPGYVVRLVRTAETPGPPRPAKPVKAKRAGGRR